MQNNATSWLLKDWATAVRRSIRHTFRNVDSLVTSLALPVMIMLLFVVVFGGAISTGTSYVNYIVPGVILVCVGYGSSTTASILNVDMTRGLFQRFRSLPMARSSLLVGHAVGSLVRNSISAALVFVVALVIGFRPDATPLEWLIVAGLLLLVIFMLTWIAIIFGLIAKSVEAAAAVSFVVMFLPYISSAFVPVNTLPEWLHGVAQYQPITPIVETVRSLLIGTPVSDTTVFWAFAWPIIILVIAIAVATSILRHKARKA
ncbi:MAG TPA: ABC transporter permease [Verrucomicrobiae bacterium]|nr:ABC transporter permease [Verrucomicrobiae bacterium]